MNEILQRIEALRLNKNISGNKLCKELGIAQSTYATWISSDTVPKVDKLQKISKYFGVSIEYLMTGKESEESNVNTIAAHHDNYDFTDEELAEIEDFKKYVLSKRKN